MEHLTIKHSKLQVTHYLKKAILKKRLSTEKDFKGKPSSGQSSSTTAAAVFSCLMSYPIRQNEPESSVIVQCWTTWESRQDGDTECWLLLQSITSVWLANLDDNYMYTNGYIQNHLSKECATRCC